VVNNISVLVFLVLMAPGLAAAWWLRHAPVSAAWTLAAWTVVVSLAASAFRIASEWQRAVVFRLGKLHGVRGPGLYFVAPVFEEAREIDTRVQAVAIARQQVITKDNVPVSIDGVLFFRVEQAAHALVRVQNFRYAVDRLQRAELHGALGSAAPPR
jgi:regulator of protease activity HflC (stomatin/prohibitin superfamily)